RQVGIKIPELFPIHVILVPARILVVGAIVLSPKTGFRRRIVVLFQHALKKSANKESVPIRIQVYSIGVAWLRVSYDGFITRMAHLVEIVVDDIVAVQVLEF